MSDLQQRIKQILTREKQVDNVVSGGVDVEFAEMPKKKMPKKKMPTKKGVSGVSPPKMMASGLVGEGCCGMCGGKLEYADPNVKGSSVSEMMNYAVANNTLSGNGVRKFKLGKRVVCSEKSAPTKKAKKAKKEVAVEPKAPPKKKYNLKIVDKLDDEMEGDGVRKFKLGKKVVCREKSAPKAKKATNTKGIEALKAYQDKVKKVMEAGFTRKEAVEMIKRFKAEGDGFFDDVWSGVKEVGETLAPLAPLLPILL